MKVHEDHKQKAPKEINLALVVVSTSRYAEIQNDKESSDKTIPLVKKIIKEHPVFSVVHTEIIADSKDQINQVLKTLINDSTVDVIIFSGGTGLSPKDITYEILEPQLEKKFHGFGEIFRSLSYNEIGTSAMLSRATAGILHKKVIFLLPGSPNAVKLALEKLIIPELGHILYLINKEE